ncbi:MAG: lysophospholipid acyltransferase family protein [Candidatus Aminicenantes bacterium]|nr:lysophospholipid acyltransferase family protein [Candidatus Aminicenantes bacterium]
MNMVEEIRWVWTGILGRIMSRLWISTCSLVVKGEESYRKLVEEGKPVVILVWHRRIFLVPFFFRRRNIMALISPSRDGEIPARIMAKWGYKIVRGSSSHAVIKAWNIMIEELKKGGQVIIVPDGPKGPNQVMKQGGLKLALETGAWLVPFTFASSKNIILNSWDRFVMIKPFSKIVAVFGHPVSVPSDLKKDNLESQRKKLEDLMMDLENQAEKLLAS